MTAAIALRMLPGLVIGLTAHECAHAWAAHLLGDGYARRLGRVSLNPFRHLSPLGTLAIFLLPIGWGKPVPVNLYNFRRPRRDYLLVSLAGPAANLLIACVCGLVMWMTGDPYGHGEIAESLMPAIYGLAHMAALINIVLATLNMLPLPPLDGSKIWPCLIPGMKLTGGVKMQSVSTAVLFVLIWTGALSPLFDWSLTSASRLLPPTTATFDEQYDRARVAYQQGVYDQAQVYATRAINLEPLFSQAHSLRAYARYRANDLEGALHDIVAALALDPDDAEYQAFRDRVVDELAEVGRRGQALQK